VTQESPRVIAPSIGEEDNGSLDRIPTSLLDGFPAVTAWRKEDRFSVFVPTSHLPGGSTSPPPFRDE